MTKPKPKIYSTRQAAKKIDVSFRTLNRWLAGGRIKPATAIKMPSGRMLWLWTAADIAKGKRINAALKPGPKPKAGRR
jgi:predicted site-specific integrase-resolvase